MQDLMDQIIADQNEFVQKCMNMDGSFRQGLPVIDALRGDDDENDTGNDSEEAGEPS